MIDEDKENRKVLYTYLQKFMSEKQASETLIKYHDTLFTYHGLAWSVGKRSLEFFCMYFLQDTFLPKESNFAAPIADVHREIWNNIEDSVIGNGPDQRGWILPRGIGKSAFGTFGASTWCHAYGLKKYTLICSDIGTTAEKFIKDIKNLLNQIASKL